jgi:uncharacterized protein (DUF4415 family)
MLAAERELNEFVWRQDLLQRPPKEWRDVERKNPTRRPKHKITLRLDEDVAIFFGWQGEGYQARINAVLRLYLLSRLGPDEKKLAQAKPVGAFPTGAKRDHW